MQQLVGGAAGWRHRPIPPHPTPFHRPPPPSMRKYSNDHQRTVNRLIWAVSGVRVIGAVPKAAERWRHVPPSPPARRLRRNAPITNAIKTQQKKKFKEKEGARKMSLLLPLLLLLPLPLLPRRHFLRQRENKQKTAAAEEGRKGGRQKLMKEAQENSEKYSNDCYFIHQPSPAPPLSNSPGTCHVLQF